MTGYEEGGPCPNQHVLDIVVSALTGQNERAEELWHTSELDSHANMFVLGMFATIFEQSGAHVSVKAFADGDKPSFTKVPIVDAALMYECKFSNKKYILVIRNAIHVPAMHHNLLCPFIMREAGLEVNEVAKIHVRPDVRTKKHHSIYDPVTGLRMPLKLNGVFSYFDTRPLTTEEMHDADKYETIYLTPDSDSWNPNTDSFAEDEAALLDDDGDIIMTVQSTHSELESTIAAMELAKYDYQLPMSSDDYERRVSDVCSISAISAELSQFDEPTSIFPSDVYNDASYLNHALQRDLETAKFQAAVGAVSGEEYDDEIFRSIDEASVKGVYAIENEISADAGLWDDDLLREMGATVAAAEFAMSAMNAGNQSPNINPEILAKIWRITPAAAARTLEVTTQLNKQNLNSSLSRHFGTNDRMLRYDRIKSTFFTDTFFVTKSAVSTRGYTMVQLFVSDKGFVYVALMKSLTEYPAALRQFAKEVGAPDILVADGHKSLKSHEVKGFCNKIGTTLKTLETNTQWADRAEMWVGLIKESTRKDMRESNSPLVLWDYCIERRALIINATAKDTYQLAGTNPHTVTLGREMDISNLQFGWYEWVYYRDDDPYPLPHEYLGRCLGPAKNEGNEMTQWILKKNGLVVPRRTVRRLKPSELALSNEGEARKRGKFDDAIEAKLGDSYNLPPRYDEAGKGNTLEEIVATLAEVGEDDPDEEFNIIDDDSEASAGGEAGSPDIPEADIVDASGKPICQQSLTDTLINAEILLPQGEERVLAKVLRRSVDENGRVIGQFNDNPILNTLVYDVELPDGTVKEYAANVIAEQILDQVDQEGHYGQQIDTILKHKRNGDAVRKDQLSTKSGSKLRKTTVGWKLLVKWKDGTQEWVDLRILKEHAPVLVADYAKAFSLVDEPAFAWWVPYTLRKRDVIVSMVSARVKKKTHKYGIEVPRTLKEAIEIDQTNGNRLWRDAYEKEMRNVSVAFRILKRGQKAPVGYTRSSGHLVFDVKMDFTRKARWVKDGHRTPDPETSNYAGVVSRESIRVALTHAALHDIPVMAADIRNAYLQAPSTEKHFIVCGQEFGLENEGCVAVIERALYGGKCAGRDYWHHLRKLMNQLGFQSSRADPDVWYRESKRKADDSAYYEYVLLYTDDILVISDRAENILRKEIGEHFTLKEESIGVPRQYLGGKLRKVELQNGVTSWAFSSAQYVKEAVKNVEDYLATIDRRLSPRTATPLTQNYRPEIDVSDELDAKLASYYQSLIGILRWIVELGRVDICVEVSMMSSHLALPRVGHLDEVLRIFAYLKCHSNAEMVFDPTEVDLPEGDFVKQDWSFYPFYKEAFDEGEELPPNMPTPKGKSMTMRVFVDSDHAGDSVTRRSRTGFVVFLNQSPIYWYSKKQGSCETSTFGSEFVAMKQACEYVKGLRYKLRMMGIPVDEPTFIYGDNQSVLANTSNPGSTLKKKSAAVAYHFVRDGCARDEWRTSYINTHLNVADLLTKPLPSGEKRWRFVGTLLHHVVPEQYL